MPRHLSRETALAFVTLSGFCLLLFLPGLGARDLTSSHEARAAQNAQMMLDEGHWLVPRLFDRHLELQKPPLYYWLVAMLGWLNDGVVSPWTVRLPAALSALITVLFVWYIGKRSGRPLAGLIAAFILASFVHFTWLARVGRIDMPLTMSVTLTLGAFHIARFDSHPCRWHALAYASLGLGILLKGPIAVVLPLVVVCVSMVHARLTRGTEYSVLRTLPWGIALTLLIAAPWYVWANVQTNNELWEVFFWHHNLERGLGGSVTLAAHPWWFYGSRAAIDLLPWGVLVPLAAYAYWQNPELHADRNAQLGLTWFGAIFLFLSCMSFKRADYLLPAYPGMALFLGSWLDLKWRDGRSCERPHKYAYVASYVAILLILVGGWTTYNYAIAADDGQPFRAMANEIRRQTRGPVVFFRAESHVLAYHLGRPMTTILEWENLDVWAQKPRVVYFVMPEDCADQWREHLSVQSLEVVLRSSDFGTCERPLVVLRNR